MLKKQLSYVHSVRDDNLWFSCSGLQRVLEERMGVVQIIGFFQSGSSREGRSV